MPVHLKIYFSALLGLVGLGVFCDLGAAVLRADSKPAVSLRAVLDEKEGLRFALNAANKKANQAQAALLDELHKQNLEAARALDTDYFQLLADTCRAHQLDPANCALTSDGQAVTVKRPPAGAAAGK